MPKRRQTRGGIERKFLTSLLWVGVVPMVLALIIGYVFAREGQMVATQQNQATAARKTAEGAWLALEGRLRSTKLLGMDVHVVDALRALNARVPPPIDKLRKRLAAEAAAAAPVLSIFAVYDKRGQLITSSEAVEKGGQQVGESGAAYPEWPETITDPSLQGFEYSEQLGCYVARAVAAVHDPESQALLGFVSATQDVQDLLRFLLGGGIRDVADGRDKNYYEVVYIGDILERRAYLGEDEAGSAPKVEYDIVDVSLNERLRRNPDRVSDAFWLWRYRVSDRSIPVLLAYHKLHEKSHLYVTVYRPVADVFANINLGAVVTLGVSSLVICFFCVVGYRIVNNTIIRPVSLLNEGAQIIRQGDLDLKLKIVTGDEIEELASSFNQMAVALRRNIAKLGASEGKYRSLITSMRDGIYQRDPDGHLTFVNPAGAQIFGYDDPSQVIGIHLRELFIEEIDFARITDALDKHGFVEKLRVWMHKASGDSHQGVPFPPRAICVELTVNRMFSSDGEVLGTEGTFRDVTRNVRLELEAKERSERIAAINQIANVINSALEVGRVYESICAELQKLVHFDYASVSTIAKEKNRIELRQLWPEPKRTEDESRASRVVVRDMDRMDSCGAWVARTGERLVIENLQRADGVPTENAGPPPATFATDFPTNIRSCLCVPLHAAGRIIGSLDLGFESTGPISKHKIEVVEQITPHVAVAIRNARLLDNLQQSLEEVTLAREKLHAANEELKSLDEMKTNLLSNVSHELRTPLVAVMGYSDMLLNGKVGPINDMQAEYLGISLRNIEKLVALIENLLDFSRLHRGAEELVFDTFDLIDCARTSIQIVKPVSESRDIELSLTAQRAGPNGDEGETPDTVLVEGDKGKLGQVFNNLLSNAVKFNESGGEVAIDMAVGDSMVEVAVSDTGIGIPEEEQDKVFTRFYQCDGSSTRKYGGTGIGLAIAQDIVRLHGGRITVTSKPEAGSTFRFSLPLKTAEHRSESGAGGAALPLPTETHLLIEVATQDRALSTQIRNILFSEGMDVIMAPYPAVAVSLANKYNPDCMLVDSEAGPMGELVIEEILREPSAKAVPIVMLTNDDELYERHRGKVAGRVKRGFRKSSLLSGIHYALSKGLDAGKQLGNKVLCVDDDPEIGIFITRCLTTEGYVVDSCLSGTEALKRVEGGDYWLVMLDIAMPGLDGWETCRRLKSKTALAGLKVYLVTAKPIDKDLRRIRKCGADGYLLKPFKAEDLLGIVHGFESRRVAPS